MRTAALVDRWGRMDWLCWPRFDSPPLLRRLVDPAGGSWQISPTSPFESTRRYLPDTNVLETVFSNPSGTAAVLDFMPVAHDADGPRVVRIIEGRAGAVPMRMRFAPTEGFSGRQHQVRREDAAVLVGDPASPVAVLAANAPIVVAGGAATLEQVLVPGDRVVAVLAGDHQPGSLAEAATAACDATVGWWRHWVGQCRLPSLHRDAVVRSALALKLLHYRPTSSLVAAPTTSLPEWIGGSRNWDYRYTWLRDTSLMTLALQQLGQHDEAMGFWTWLANTAARHGDDLSIAYTVDGDPVPPERDTGLPGYRGSPPVRVGNAAAGQRQHDVYGHVIDAAAHCYHSMDMDVASPPDVLARLADLAAARWHRPDDSIWEVRGGRARHTYSAVMCWLALDRAIDLVDHGAINGDRAVWAAQREALRRAVLDRAWDPSRGAFTTTLDDGGLDAAVLAIPLVGFLPPGDPRCRSTRQVISDRLLDRGLLRRRPVDGDAEEPEGAFLLATLWLADAHTVDDDPDRGHELLDRVLSTANDLGLLAEEADPHTCAPLGNFPQGLTHLGVIQSVQRLTTAVDNPARPTSGHGRVS